MPTVIIGEAAGRGRAGSLAMSASAKDDQASLRVGLQLTKIDIGLAEKTPQLRRLGALPGAGFGANAPEPRPKARRLSAREIVLPYGV